MKWTSFIALYLICLTLFSQSDRALFQYDTVKKATIARTPYKLFKSIPNNSLNVSDISNYQTYFHQPPVCQGNTGTCWCFAATSFLESEIYRIGQLSVKLSEMYFVYWEYVERAIDFVRTRGKTYVDEGSEASALLRLIPKYGVIPATVYDGKPAYRKFHSHRQMVVEIKNFLEYVKKHHIWNETYVAETVKSLLQKEMGTPPKTFEFNGQTFTPLSFANEFLQINSFSYFRFMSTLSVSFYEKHELIENDNWWHDDEYYNVPVDTFLKIVKQSLINGYTVCLCGDISEAGYDASETKTAQIPLFDIPLSDIDDASRENRLQNATTTDDHCVHIVGYTQLNNGTYWFLIKDSNGQTFDGNNSGYRFFSESYIKLKMMNILVHSDAARWLLEKIIK